MTFVRVVGLNLRTIQIVFWIVFGITFNELFILTDSTPENKFHYSTNNGLKYQPSNVLQKTSLAQEYSHYKTYDEIIEFLAVEPANKNIFYEVTSAGKTFEGRDIPLVKISSNPNAGKPAILIDAGAHAREWASVASLTFLIETLKEGASLLQHADWYIIPIVNPDGYVYSMTPGNRLWRKNRSKVEGTECVGVDLNRNYGYHWGESGVSMDPCDPNTYPGPGPFSENETQAVKDIMIKYQKKIKAYVTLHAFGQFILYPYGYAAKTLPNNWKQLKKIGHMMSKAIHESTSNNYTVESSGDWYPSAGASDDFAYGVMNTTLTFTVELTDDPAGFKYPQSKLPVPFRELYEVMYVLCKETAKKFTDNYYLDDSVI